MVANRGKKPRPSPVEDDEHLRNDRIFQAIEKLQQVQDELEKVNEKAHEEILAIEQKYNEIRDPVYKRRNEIISAIPDFWLTAFMHHPVLGSLLNEEDQKIFKYLDSLVVEDFSDPRRGYSIMFTFKANPYFDNTKLTKTVNFSNEGAQKSIGTTISWKEGMEPVDERNDEKNGNKRSLPLDSFFGWFSYPHEEKVEVQHDVVADLIKNEMWPNPIEHLNNAADDDDLDDDDEEDEEDEEEDAEDDSDEEEEDEEESSKDEEDT